MNKIPGSKILMLLASHWVLTGCSTIPDLEAGKRAVATGEMEKAKIHFKTLSERGVPDAHRNLGDIYRNEGNLKDAINQYQAALNAGDENSHLSLIRTLYRKNIGGNQPEKAMEELKLLLEKDEIRATNETARLLHEWPELLPLKERLVWFERAAETSNMDSYLFKGEALLNDMAQCVNCETDHFPKARKALLEVAAFRPRAIKSLVELYKAAPSEGSLTELLADLQSRNLDAGRVYYVMGNTFYRDNSQPDSLIAAKEHYLLSASTYPKAWSRLYTLLIRNPEITDALEMDALAVKSRESGFDEIDIWEARRLIQGIHSKIDPFEAEKLLVKHQGNPEADYRLGRIYLTSMLGEPQFKKAFTLLDSAGSQGKSAAYFEIAKVLQEGQGIPVNNEKAIEYASLAFNEGDNRALAILQNLNAVPGLDNPFPAGLPAAGFFAEPVVDSTTDEAIKNTVDSTEKSGE